MPRKDPPTSRIELLQGTLDFIVLQTLRWGPCHVETGSLYPALQRLMRQGAIAPEWGTSDNNRRVRLYRLTPKGRSRLAAERSKWEQLSDAIASLMRPPTVSET